MTVPPNPTTVGTRTEGMVLAALLQLGKAVLLPFGGGARYDLAYDEGGRLVRVQCKTAKRTTNGCLLFNSRSIGYGGEHRDYRGDADLFGVYAPELGVVYLVPVDLVATNTGSLRLDPTRNGQAKGVLWASDYQVSGPR